MELSGGEQQAALSLAVQLIIGPTLLADERPAIRNSRTGTEFMELIHSFHQSLGMTC